MNFVIQSRENIVKIISRLLKKSKYSADKHKGKLRNSSIDRIQKFRDFRQYVCHGKKSGKLRIVRKNIAKFSSLLRKIAKFDYQRRVKNNKIRWSTVWKNRVSFANRSQEKPQKLTVCRSKILRNSSTSWKKFFGTLIQQ